MKTRHRHYKKKFDRHYTAVRDRAANSRGAYHIGKRPILLPIIGFLMGIGVVGAVVFAQGGQTFHVSDSHVVYLFDKRKEETLTTKASTVGELIDKLPLNLVPQDVVEPSRNTEIVEDNFRINIYRARPVTVVNGKDRIVTLTAQKSPRVVAKDAGLSVFAEDKVTFSQGTLKENIIGEKVMVDPAFPVFLNLYGTQLNVRTHTETVADLLHEKRVKLTDGDEVQPALNTKVTQNMQVFILRKGTKITTVEEPIPAPRQVVEDGNLSLGATAVRQAGSPGRKVVTYQIQMTNDAESGRTVIQEVIAQHPVPEIIVRGTRVLVNGDKVSWMIAAGIPSSSHGYANYIISHESRWNYLAQNRSSGAYGLCQALPGSKMATAGADWATNPITQLKWCHGYAISRYGSWSAAYNFWLSRHYW